MSALEVTLPDSVRERIEYFADQEGKSPDAFVADIIARRIAVAEADSYIRERGARGCSERLVELLDQAPDVEPEAHDRVS